MYILFYTLINHIYSHKEIPFNYLKIVGRNQGILLLI
jgi:hypothetical protein